MRICIAYDCLFPWTVGGAERWYRNLAERLVADGHEVTYITLRQWDSGDPPNVPGVTVRAVGPRMALYSGNRRRILPPLVYGAGVFWHLVRKGRRYDVVQLASFPYFSLLAAAAARPRGGYDVVVDWFEVWSREYWRAYLGRVGGAIGYAVQRMCTRVRQRAFCFSSRHAQHLRDEGLRGAITPLRGLFVGPEQATAPVVATSVAIFVGRHIPEKRAPAVVAAVSHARRQIPALRGIVYGDGPDRTKVLDAIVESSLEDIVDAPGFVDHDALVEGMRSALCLVHPSSREGYGLVVVEAAQVGLPTIVVDGPDNAAVELIVPGENGFVARSAEPQDLAEAIVAVHQAGHGLRLRTAAWFDANARELSLESSLTRVLESYSTAADRS